jgi:predicted RNA-binding Zn-ribbon protein involved in translation (DUF1610 family)
MNSIAVEIKIECKSCGNSIAMNALNTEFECKSCFEYIKLSHGSLAGYIKEIIKRVLEKNENRLKVTGNIIPFYLEGMQCNRLYGRTFPIFNGIQLDMETIIKNAEAGFVLIGENKILIRPVPQNFADQLAPVKYLVGEDEEQMTHLPGDTRKKNLEGGVPILFSCLACGGSLTADGTTRILECTYCKNSSYIPDALWLKFHPVSRVKRWYLIF